VINFFTIQDYKHWENVTQDSFTWKKKYYKGLGTSTDKEAQVRLLLLFEVTILNV